MAEVDRFYYLGTPYLLKYSVMNTSLKRVSLAAVVILFGLGVSGQNQIPLNGPWEDEKFFNAGYTIGFNVMTFGINPSEQFTLTDSVYPARGSVSPGLNIHLALNFRLNQFFDIRLLPGISFGQRNVKYSSDRVHDTLFTPQKSSLMLLVASITGMISTPRKNTAWSVLFT